MRRQGKPERTIGCKFRDMEPPQPQSHTDRCPQPLGGDVSTESTIPPARRDTPAQATLDLAPPPGSHSQKGPWWFLQRGTAGTKRRH